MSVQSVEAIILRMSEDPEYLALVAADPSAALHGYDLTVAERQALIAGDQTKLEQLGVSSDLSRLAGLYNQGAERML